MLNYPPFTTPVSAFLRLTTENYRCLLRLRTNFLPGSYNFGFATTGRPLGMELYLKDIASRWRKEFSRSAQRKLVFSPYVTSGTAENVVGQSEIGACEIHTVFAVELFASQASSLKTLRTLMERGHKLFHLPGLHAKLFLIPGSFASVGSQNLTYNGTRNREASVVTRRPKLLKALEADLAPWLGERIEITPEMLDDMAEIVGEIEPLYETARQAAEVGEAQMRERAGARREAAERQRLCQCLIEQLKALQARRANEAAEAVKKAAAEAKRRTDEADRERLREAAERQRQAKREKQQRQACEAELQRQRVSALQINIRGARQSLDVAYTSITVIRNSDTGHEQTTLLAENGRDLCRWRIGNQTIQLEYGKRYLILHETGKLGWGRLVKTRMSFFGQGVDWTTYASINQRSFKVSMRGDWERKPKYGRNIVFEVSDENKNGSCQVSCWFDLKDLEVLAVELHPNRSGTKSNRRQVLDSLHNNMPAFKTQFLSLITSPFEYKSTFHGVDPRSFFADMGSNIRLKAALVQNNPILLSQGHGF